ncbi:alpha/beta hydrolase [Fibrella forsythiae]|uniref:Alpha/beta hydrolase n=1 Tax=Fibrella forsythiae TaxID=2817061 RepID=A0ABS3JDX8_9BACT|nr:alpha/beta hydrolase [Fibrella forsythiae]MBO0947087.1 alpha/beta hydrolase [Fibrella forsythiae]
MRLIYLFSTLLILAAGSLRAQAFMPLWPAGKMPNTKGMRLTDSIANERIYRVGTPGMYTFFPSIQENKGAAVVICPGGGYERLAYIISGQQLAKWFNTMGISAFVLNYRLPNSPDLIQRELGPLQDAQRAMQVIRANAQKWGIRPDKIGIQGTSAGGHLAALLGTSTSNIAAIGDSISRLPVRPDFMILVSPVITMGQYAHAGSRKNLLGPNPSADQLKTYSLENAVTASTPPCFLVHAFNDTGVDQRNSLLFYQALVDMKVSSSLHTFPQGAHAIALRNNPGSTQQWVTLCESWLREMNFLTDTK